MTSLGSTFVPRGASTKETGDITDTIKIIQNKTESKNRNTIPNQSQHSFCQGNLVAIFHLLRHDRVNRVWNTTYTLI